MACIVAAFSLGDRYANGSSCVHRSHNHNSTKHHHTTAAAAIISQQQKQPRIQQLIRLSDELSIQLGVIARIRWANDEGPLWRVPRMCNWKIIGIKTLASLIIANEGRNFLIIIFAICFIFSLFNISLPCHTMKHAFEAHVRFIHAQTKINWCCGYYVPALFLILSLSCSPSLNWMPFFRICRWFFFRNKHFRVKFIRYRARWLAGWLSRSLRPGSDSADYNDGSNARAMMPMPMSMPMLFGWLLVAINARCFYKSRLFIISSSIFEHMIPIYLHFPNVNHFIDDKTYEKYDIHVWTGVCMCLRERERARFICAILT